MKILIIEDSETDRLSYQRYFQSDSKRNYYIIEAETLEDGLHLWRLQQPDLVLLNMDLPDGNGLAFLEKIRPDSW
ncbi:MAG: PleD family two-component system response regulator, partial [Microcystaceae cyanobacterium]